MSILVYTKTYFSVWKKIKSIFSGRLMFSTLSYFYLIYSRTLEGVIRILKMLFWIYRIHTKLKLNILQGINLSIHLYFLGLPEYTEDLMDWLRKKRRHISKLYFYFIFIVLLFVKLMFKIFLKPLCEQIHFSNLKYKIRISFSFSKQSYLVACVPFN